MNDTFVDRDCGKNWDPYRRLVELGLPLPPVSPSKGEYIPAVRTTDGWIFVAGQIPLVNGKLEATGLVGDDVDAQAARLLASRCALSALAAVHQVASLTEVTCVVKVVGYVACAPGFTDLDYVVDGASELLTAVLGPAGLHARSTVGFSRGPLDTPVEVDITVRTASERSVKTQHVV